MRDGKFINGTNLYLLNSLEQNTYKQYGIGLTTLNVLQQRLEFFKKTSFKDSSSLMQFKYSVFLNTLLARIPFNLNLKFIFKTNIITLHLINSYKGYRHLRGLPVNGQRTWSNGWSSFRSNYTLRFFKLDLSKKFYGNVSYADIKVAFLAEQTNLLWKNQWYQIWKKISANRSIGSKAKKLKRTQKPDLLLMAKGHIFLPLLKRDLTKKQKTRYDQSLFACGYRVGFTKELLKDVYKTNVEGISSKSVLLQPETRNKKQKKKSSDLKIKQIKHKQKKQKKKSVWD